MKYMFQHKIITLKDLILFTKTLIYTGTGEINNIL